MGNPQFDDSISLIWFLITKLYNKKIKTKLGELMVKTNFGKWSVGFILAMFVLFVIGSSLTNTLYESVPAGGTIFADIISRPALAISMLV
ncbi:MAG: hypothetical protein ACTSPB_14440, partial [Candidatus Thorarchaeota archaeon]